MIDSFQRWNGSLRDLSNIGVDGWGRRVSSKSELFKSIPSCPVSPNGQLASCQFVIHFDKGASMMPMQALACLWQVEIDNQRRFLRRKGLGGRRTLNHAGKSQC